MQSQLIGKDSDAGRDWGQEEKGTTEEEMAGWGPVPLLSHSAPGWAVQLSLPYMTTGKTIALNRWTFVGKVMSLLFNTLSRLVITFCVEL